MEYIKQLENDRVCVSYVKIMPYEDTGLHYDQYPHLVIALEGGTITRIESDGSKQQIEFPTGKTIFRPSETVEKMHTSVSKLPSTKEDGL
ncbi:hypothetical protein H0X06_03405 [Candidatus Dependentiae bacterium]|nr:hypothetical protein [Candidatus Dependentiae bacterium]